MSYDPNDKSTDDLVEEWLEHNPMEGRRGLKSLGKFLTAVGYKQDTYGGVNIGNQIEGFLEDNPEAIETLIRFCNSRGDYNTDQTARKNIIAGLPPACPKCGYYFVPGTKDENGEEEIECGDCDYVQPYEVYQCDDCGSDVPWDGDNAKPAVCPKGCEAAVV